MIKITTQYYANGQPLEEVYTDDNGNEKIVQYFDNGYIDDDETYEDEEESDEDEEESDEDEEESEEESEEETYEETEETEGTIDTNESVENLSLRLSMIYYVKKGIVVRFIEIYSHVGDWSIKDYRGYSSLNNLQDFIKHSYNDEPAYIRYDEDYNITKKLWYNNDLRHRDNDKPAIILYDDECNITTKKWFNNGELHRDNDKPEIIHYYDNGNIEYEAHHLDGILHRDNDLPALIEYTEDGNLLQESWYVNGRLQRTTGPAIYRLPDNDLDTPTSKWFINDIDKTEEITQYIKDHKIKTNEKGELVNKLDIMLFKLLWS